MNLEKLVTEIKKEHQQVVQTVRKSIDHAKKAGELLSKAKEQVEATTAFKWGRWVEQECGILERTASNYIRVFAHWSEIDAKMKEKDFDPARLTLRAALAMLKTTTRKPKNQPQPLTLTGLRELMAQHHLNGDPAELLALLKEIGLKLPPVAEEEPVAA